MTDARRFIETCNAASREMAADGGWRASPAPANASVRGLVYRRVWPTTQSLDWLDEVGVDPLCPGNGWLDSSLDLRDGLSVVEVFATAVVADELFADLAH